MAPEAVQNASGLPGRIDATVAFVTMGCAKNEVDSDHMARRLEAAGYDVIDDPGSADLVIVNTCSFIQAATEESIDAVLEAANLDHISKGPGKLVVAGCMPARYGDDLADEFPEVSGFVPCAHEEGIVGIADGLLGIERIGDGSRVAREAARRSEVFAYVKISDGCDRFCSYCSIPYIRGRYRSFPEEDIVAEVERVVAEGVREVVLIAQDTGRWGDDLPEPSTLARLLDALATSFPDTWFRVMYIQPEGVTDELLSVMAARENVCSYLDIPFQHCDADVLKRMNRHGSRGQFMQLIGHARESVPGVTLRTTLIAGFPGETEEQFEDLCGFVEDAELDYVGVFPYSREEGTRAHGLDGQVGEDEKAYRAQRLRDVADAVSSAVVAARIGSTVNVLVCGCEEDGQVYGRAQSQAPDVDGVTYLPCGERGSRVRVTIADTLLYEMEGEIVS